MSRKWTLEQRIEGRRRRLDKRRREELPLFAAAGGTVLSGVAPLPTEQEVRDWYRRQDDAFREWQERMAQFRQRMSEEAQKARDVVGFYITSDQVEHIDAYITRSLPPDPVYAADYWGHLLHDLGIVLAAEPEYLCQSSPVTDSVAKCEERKR